MKQNIPKSEIIKDLLTENWQLRWQVLEIFAQVRVKYYSHTQNSIEKREILRLGKKLCTQLNGPHDHNLHLIMTAAFFLGGNHFLFLIFQHLGIDDSSDLYPDLAKTRKALTSEQSSLTFYDYFHLILSSNSAAESTTAIAAAISIRLFSPAKALSLLITIPHSEPRMIALDLFQEAYPEQFFNKYLLAQPRPLLFEQPELLRFVAPPLSNDQSAECATLINTLLVSTNHHYDTALQAVARLKLYQFRDILLKQTDENNEIATVLAQLGDDSGCTKLLSTAQSWRRNKRLTALTGLGYCNSLEALTILKKRYFKGDRSERSSALNALGHNRHPDTLTSLISILTQSEQLSEQRTILKLLVQHPNSGSDPETANLLARWHKVEALYPELLEALETFGYGDKWTEIITILKTPLGLKHQQELALFMTRFAGSLSIRKHLLSLLDNSNWAFSYQLLTLLQPYMDGRDLETLLTLLQECEEIRDLTIQERLTQDVNIANFRDALCEHLDLNPNHAKQALSHFIADLVDGNLPTKAELNNHFQKQPAALKKLILGTSEFSSSLPEPGLPLLHFLKILSQIELKGASCLVTIINRTRKYSGFLRQLINASISAIIDKDPNLLRAETMPKLQAFIDFMRQRQDYDKLRQKIILHIKQVTRKARDLRIYHDATHNRDLRVINVMKTNKETTTFKPPQS